MKLNNFDVKNNFWEVNSNFLILDTFKELYENDKSKKKDNSSKFMWGLSLLLHPDSILFNISITERRRIISAEYMHNEAFNWKEVDGYVQAYQKLVLSSAERQLMLWTRFMDEKTEFMSSLEYKTSWEEIEKMLLSNGKLYSELQRITEQIEKQAADGAVKGDAEESASERGEI